MPILSFQASYYHQYYYLLLLQLILLLLFTLSHNFYGITGIMCLPMLIILGLLVAFDTAGENEAL